MPQLVNPTHEDLTLPGVGRIESGCTLDVSDTVAAAYVGHPVIEVVGYTPQAPAEADTAAEQVAVSGPADSQEAPAPPETPASSTETAQ